MLQPLLQLHYYSKVKYYLYHTIIKRLCNISYIQYAAERAQITFTTQIQFGTCNNIRSCSGELVLYSMQLRDCETHL